MIRVYHTAVTNPSSTDTTSTTASTATEYVICWTCLGLTVNTAGEYMITRCIGIYVRWEYYYQLCIALSHYNDTGQAYIYIQIL